MNEPSVIAAGARLVERLHTLNAELARKQDTAAGCESVFIGQIHSGEIFNQYPQECWLEGTRRWPPGTSRVNVEKEFRAILDETARDAGTTIDIEFHFIRDAFHLDREDPLVDAFHQSYETISGRALPVGPKPFVDDGNSFWGHGEIPAITHGPQAGGQHTVDEWVSIPDLERVALLYAATAVAYCDRK